MDILFEFLKDYEDVNLQELAVTAYNLALCYFYWDIFKFVFNGIRYFFRRYEK